MYLWMPAFAVIPWKLIPVKTLVKQQLGINEFVTREYRNRKYLAWGDGAIDGNDLCDDYSTNDGDECSANCLTIETRFEEDTSVFINILHPKGMVTVLYGWSDLLEL